MNKTTHQKEVTYYQKMEKEPTVSNNSALLWLLFFHILNHRFETHGTAGRMRPCCMQAKLSYTDKPAPLGSFKLFLPALIVFMKFFLESLFSIFSKWWGAKESMTNSNSVKSILTTFHFWLYFIFSISSAFDSLKQFSLAWKFSLIINTMAH